MKRPAAAAEKMGWLYPTLWRGGMVPKRQQQRVFAPHTGHVGRISGRRSSQLVWRWEGVAVRAIALGRLALLLTTWGGVVMVRPVNIYRGT